MANIPVAPARQALALVLATAALGACVAASGAEVSIRRESAPPTTTTAAPSTTTTPPPLPEADAGAPDEPVAAPAPAPAPPAADPAPRERLVTEQAFVPFANAGPVTLVHPVARVERVAFHEANHDGAREMEPLPSAVAAMTLESRKRGTTPRSAVDIVADPAGEVRAPVTGRVKRGGAYTLYCKHTDGFLVIEPDAHPGWEVKLLHITAVSVSAGQRVVAGETVVAAHPTQLPFESQVDAARTADPAWPHVHIEVVDPSIKNKPAPGGGGGSGGGCS